MKGNSPVSRFLEDLSFQISQPVNEERVCVVGARFTLVNQFGDTIHISTVRTPKKLRGKGLAGFGTDVLCFLADKHGVTLKTDCSGVNKAELGLSTSQLASMFLKRNFKITDIYFNGDLKMTRIPQQQLFAVPRAA